MTPKVERAPARLDSIAQFYSLLPVSPFFAALGPAEKRLCAVRIKCPRRRVRDGWSGKWVSSLLCHFSHTSCFFAAFSVLPLFRHFSTFGIFCFFLFSPCLGLFLPLPTSPVLPLPICTISFVLSFFCRRCAFKLRAMRRYVNASILDRG